jgi:hypothetical protein
MFDLASAPPRQRLLKLLPKVREAPISCIAASSHRDRDRSPTIPYRSAHTPVQCTRSRVALQRRLTGNFQAATPWNAKSGDTVRTPGWPRVLRRCCQPRDAMQE